MRLFLFFGLFLVISSVNSSVKVDVNNQLDASLKQKGKVLLRIDMVLQSLGSGIRIPTPRPVKGFLTVKNHEIIKVNDLVFDGLEQTDWPIKVINKGFKAKNCSSTSLNVSETLSVSSSVGESFSLSKTVGSSKSVSANASINFIGIGGGVSYSQTRSVSLTESKAQSFSESLSRSETVSKSVASGKEVWANLEYIEYNSRFPFTASVIVDGSLNSNMSGKTKASQLLTEKERTLVVNGWMDVTLASDLNFNVYERDVDINNPMVCESTPNKKKKQVDKLIVEKFDGDIVFNDLTLATPLFNKTIKGNTPNFTGNGVHQCQSITDIGHTCPVMGWGYMDCNAAHVNLSSQDCCSSTKTCSFDPMTGQQKCRFGGNSIGFTMGMCLPH